MLLIVKLSSKKIKLFLQIIFHHRDKYLMENPPDCFLDNACYHFYVTYEKSRNPISPQRAPAPHNTTADSRLTTIMITLFKFICNLYTENIQNFYDDFICSLQMHQLVCSCGRAACLTIHGYYKRTLKTPRGPVRMRICRVRCSACKITHALMPVFIVPYSQTSLPDQVEIIRNYEEGNRDFSALMERCPSIDENNIKAVVRNYLHCWKQRLLSFSIPLAPMKDLVAGCFGHCKYQFMQVKETVNVLFAQTT